MNLFPVYKRVEDAKTVRKGKFYSWLYVFAFLITLIAWVIVVSIPSQQTGYVSMIHPPNYDPSNVDSENVEMDVIETLYKDPEKKNVQCKCSNSDPILNDFAIIETKQYEFCTYLMERYSFETCVGFNTRADAAADGKICPSGLTKDENNYEAWSIRSNSQQRYVMNQLWGLCKASFYVLEGVYV